MSIISSIITAAATEINHTAATDVVIALFPAVVLAGMVMATPAGTPEEQVVNEELVRTEEETEETDGVEAGETYGVDAAAASVEKKDTKTTEKSKKKAEKKKKQKAKKSKKAKSMTNMIKKLDADDNGKKTKPAEPVEPAEQAKQIAVPTEDTNSSLEVVINRNKLGALYGTGGMTLKIIQDITNTSINLPERDTGSTATVTVTGENQQSVAHAARIVKDLSDKGYCALLEGNDFTESSVKVPLAQVHEIIGKGGRVIREIQEQLDCKVNVPDTSNTGRKKVIKVGLAGTQANVEEARAVIKSIVRFHYHSLTHPGMTHAEMEVPSHNFSAVIGPRGSNIKHLQNSYDVKINIPSAEMQDQKVIVTGPTSGVKFAVQEIEKVVHRANCEENYSETDSYSDEDEGFEAWMVEFSPPCRQTSGATWD